MNDENLENYLYQQFNEILDSQDDYSTKQDKLGKLFMMASNSISAIYLVQNQDKTKAMMKQFAPEMDQDINFARLLENQWYIYTNINVWIDFLHSVYNEIAPTHAQYEFYGQIMDAVKTIENELGLDQTHLVS